MDDLKGITFQLEKMIKIKKELIPLFAIHDDEVRMKTHAFPLDVDWETYGRLEDMGVVSVSTARDNRKLIGYFIYIILPSLHAKTMHFADGDAFYLDKDYRKSTIAARLLAFAEKDLIRRGAKAVIHKSKDYLSNNNGVPYGRFFEDKGYVKYETSYVKML